MHTPSIFNNLGARSTGYALLQSSNSREFLMRIAAGTSASMKKINRANLLKCRLPVPDIDTQLAILNELKKLKQATASIQIRMGATKGMAALLINKAVAGANI